MSENITPVIVYPPQLPISARREEIIRLIRQNRVLIIAGETGSGKTTQIPKFCLEAGRGKTGRIACTQPRRIAAVSVATRLAEEMGEEIGGTVGYQIRFSERTAQNTRIKLMTDGILLSEIRNDRLLNRYDTIIIDEAHERSLNIDFILGILRRILKKRADLKIIITSATIDTLKFSQAFDNAPVIEVSGRTFPVEIRYHAENRGNDIESYVEQTIREVLDICDRYSSGDILAFMPTEQDIRETCEGIRKNLRSSVDILPLYARMNAADQHRVFDASQSRKIIVATNIAETSITIPGIHFVVDTGLARIASYSPATRTNALPISPVSRSSADQRAGRCGRVSNGICIRLYSEEDYHGRDRFTLPEILRSNLAEVLMRMIALEVENIEAFPFIDPPSKKAIHDGLELLVELGATERKQNKNGRCRYVLTKTGKIMAFLPLDPRISRILIEGSTQGCLREMAVLAAVLSIQEPRERPVDRQKQADEIHKRFTDSSSDLITLLNIWDDYHLQWRQNPSKSQMRKYCEQNFISYRRMREWRDIHLQITATLKEQGIRLSPTILSRIIDKKRGYSPFYRAIHLSFLSGYMSNIAQKKEKHFYTATKNRTCMIFPGSGIFPQPPEWITAAEMVRTSQLFARTAARVEPEWIIRMAGNLGRRTYHSPSWSFEREEVTAVRQTRVYGLLVEPGAYVGYGQIDPAVSSRIFCEEALVVHVQRYEERFTFLSKNSTIIREILDMENRLRRRDIFSGYQQLKNFYTRKLPGISSLAGLEKFIRVNGEENLLINREDFMLHIPGEEELKLFPGQAAVEGREYSLAYCFSPDEKEDGVSIILEEDDAPLFNTRFADWLVPGLLKDKVFSLIKGLPKQYRRELVPVNRTVDRIMELLPCEPSSGLTETLSELIRSEFDTYIPSDAWNADALPSHLRYKFTVTSSDGKILKTSRNPDILLEGRKIPNSENALAVLKKKYEKTRLSEWVPDVLDSEVTDNTGFKAFPAFVPGDNCVEIRLFTEPEAAMQIHRKGVAVLSSMYMKDILAIFMDEVLLQKPYTTRAMYFGGLKDLNKGIRRCLIENILGSDVRTKTGFLAFLDIIRTTVYESMKDLAQDYARVVDAYCSIRNEITAILEQVGTIPGKREFGERRLEDLCRLIPKDFYQVIPAERLKDITRYAKCIAVRCARGIEQPSRDADQAQSVSVFRDWYEKTKEALLPGAGAEKRRRLDEYYWAIEELKIQLFAQEIKTAIKISPKRLEKMAAEIEELR